MFDPIEYAQDLAQFEGLDDPAKAVAAFVALEAKEPWRAMPAGFWPAVQAEMERMAAAFVKPAFWAFEDSGAAYDAGQCNVMIKSGDLIVVEAEKVVGLAWAWPVAVSAEAGKLHNASDPAVVNEVCADGAAALAKAKAECLARGWPIDPVFIG